MNIKKSVLESGQSLMEVIFAVALFTVGVVTIGYMHLGVAASGDGVRGYTMARNLAREGITLMHSMANTRFDELEDGTFGISLTDTEWVLEATPMTHDGYERSIQIQTIDEDTKEVVVMVRWSERDTISRNVAYTTWITNWMQKGGDREALVARTEYATVNTSSTSVLGLEVSNTSDAPITITHMRFKWVGPAQLTRIVYEGNEVYGSISGSSSPDGNDADADSEVISGESVDIDDIGLNPYSGFRTIDAVDFDAPLSSSNLHVTFELSDGTIRYVPLTL